MYEAFYNFSAKPFQLSPDPTFFFGSRGHKRAMSYLEYGLHQGEGFIVVTGEVGAGKTTLVRNLFRKLETQHYVAAQLVSTQLDETETLRTILGAFGLPHEDLSKAVMLSRLQEYLLAARQQGKRALLVVDEAQNLSSRAVEELRMLSNFQGGDGSLLQSFLLGQPEFRQTMQGEGMQQLRQRVIASCHLGPLDLAETKEYIEHRLRTVGWTGDPSFTDGAYAMVHEHSGGIPRRINTICDRVLLCGYMSELRAFDSAVVKEVVDDLEAELAAPEQKFTPSMMRAATRNDDAELIDAETELTLNALSERVGRIEKQVLNVLRLSRQILSLPNVRSLREQITSK
jgi:putative secretion ATPase (PEP-CTERM system associated)